MRPTTRTTPPEQEYPYGWRFVKRACPDGGEELEQVPLTLQDVLHPREGDVIPESKPHEVDRRYLANVFESRPPEPAHAVVTSDLIVRWGHPTVGDHAPDVAVFVGLRREPDPGMGSLDLPASGGRCALVVEVVSPSTRENDVKSKLEHYHKVGVPFYVIIDQEREGGPRTLRAYSRKAHGYAEVESDDLDRIDLPQPRLTLGLKDGRAVCYEYGTMQELGDYAQTARALREEKEAREEMERAMEEQVAALHDAQKESDSQREAARNARAQADAAQKEIDRQRDEADRQRQEADTQRREADNQRREADNQRRAREAADQRVRDLEEALRRLQAGGATSTA